MRNIRNFRGLRIALSCLVFTGAAVAWADPARPANADYVEDPMAPHNTTGNTARLGTSVGFLNGDPANHAGAATSLGDARATERSAQPVHDRPPRS